ncbi:MAG: hypothetical protein Q9168_003633 [Polycauliona sp. 1 TL-2023]
MAESTFPGTNPFGGGEFGTAARGSSGNIHNVAEEDEHAAEPSSRVPAPSGSTNPFSGSNSNFSFGQSASADSKPPSAFRLGVNDGDGGLPSNYHMTRRTSVSAESLNPSAADDNWKPPYHAKSADQIDRLKDSVSSNFLFAHLPDESSSVVLDALVEKPIPAKDIKVISQGDAGDYFYIVEKGTFDIYINSTGSIEPGPQGMGEKVTSIGPGGSFGELALMYNAPRAATVISTEANSNLWALDRVTFRRILMDSAFQRRRMYESFLEEVPLLSSLTKYERNRIADALETQKFSDGQVIIQEGDKGEAFFMVEQGEAEVFKKDAGGQAIKQYQKGDYFGELALLDDKPRAASVLAKGECKVATLGKDGFQRLLGSVEAIMRRTDYSQTGKEAKEIGQ